MCSCGISGKVSDECHQQMTQEGIAGLMLRYLDCSENRYIGDVSWMVSLRSLTCQGKACALGPDGIKGLKLYDFDSCNNDKFGDDDDDDDDE